MAGTMLDFVLNDMPLEQGQEVALLISGLGATPVMELYIYYAEIERRLTAKGVRVHRSYVGNYFTSLEMMGVTLTLTLMTLMTLDDELKTLLDMPAQSLGLTQVE